MVQAQYEVQTRREVAPPEIGRQPPPRARGEKRRERNVSDGERLVSAAAGSLLIWQGLVRRDVPGLMIAGVGGALIVRGATGRSRLYQALGVDSRRDGRAAARKGVQVSVSMLINKSPEELYAYWHNFENLPRFMSHLESVRNVDGRQSHWVAKAPKMYGGQVEWDAELTADEPGARIAWQSLPDSDVQHTGAITFARALGDRGTRVHVDLNYQPPAGQLGRWVAKLFGEEPEQQIQDDLRNFKRFIELGEILTVEGQPHGTCVGQG